MMLGDGARGAIVNITSVHEQIPWKRYSHYCASKAGQKLFGQSIARELAPHGIRVVAVAPGAIETPINRDVLADPQVKAQVLEEISLGRWGTVDDVARVVAWVASARPTTSWGRRSSSTEGWRCTKGSCSAQAPEVAVVSLSRQKAEPAH